MKSISLCLLFLGLSIAQLSGQIALKDAYISVTNEENINTEELEFSPVFYKDGIVFISTKSVNGNLGPQTKEKFMSIFRATRNSEDELDNVESFARELISDVHEGPVSFNRTGDVIYFTRNELLASAKKNKSEGDDKTIRRLKVFSATLVNNVWTDIQEMPFNMEGSNTAHPTISADGNTIFFASDRPGGQGGMDLYVVQKTGSTWGEPMNLGPEVNSENEEVFPYIHADGTLYFSSDGHEGNQGGLDLFYTTKSGEQWTTPVNLGSDFNTEADDLGIIVDRDNKNGYFSSNRSGGKGGDDIYSFYIEGGKVEPKEEIMVKVIDPTGAVVPDAIVSYAHLDEVRLSSAAGDVDQGFNTLILQKITNDNPVFVLRADGEDDARMATTDAAGMTPIKVRSGEYVVKATKPGFLSAQLTFEVPLQGTNLILLTLRPPVGCVPVEGTIAAEGNAPLPGVRVKVRDVDSGKEEEVVSGPDGKFEYCLQCGRQYEFYLSKNPARKQFISTITEPCDRTLAVNFQLNSSDPDDSRIIADAGGRIGGGLTEGAIIQLPNIYYNFDDASLRRDARRDLDLVVRMLNMYPEMKIQLNSHTDSRGTNEYNQRLSRRRADNAVAYIVSKGIDSGRITAQGFGEEQLINECSDGVPCSEAKHQKNRRTEIVITTLGDQKLLGQNEVAPYNQGREQYSNSFSATDFQQDWNTSPVASEDPVALQTSFHSFTDNTTNGSDSFSRSSRGYYVIAGTFSNSDNAYNRLQHVKNLGYRNAHLMQVDASLQAVCVERYDDNAQAENLVRTLQQQNGVKAYVRQAK